MDIDPLPSPELPVSLLYAVIEACSHKIHQSESSFLTRVFEGCVLMFITHSVAMVHTEMGCPEDKGVNSASEGDPLSDDSRDDPPDGSSLVIDVDNDAHPEELRVHTCV